MIGEGKSGRYAITIQAKDVGLIIEGVRAWKEGDA